MRDHDDVPPAKPSEVERILKRAGEELRKCPEVSDEDFMAEFEVSDEEYGLGVVMPGIGKGDEE